MTKIAIVQESSELLNREKTIQKAVLMVEQAVANGAELVVFPLHVNTKPQQPVAFE